MHTFQFDALGYMDINAFRQNTEMHFEIQSNPKNSKFQGQDFILSYNAICLNLA